jgi:hypothetical protein
VQEQLVVLTCVEHRYHDRMGRLTLTSHEADVGDQALVQDGFDR